MSYWESKGMIETAKEEGRMEGEKIGIEKGEKIGIEKGRVEGEKIGIEKGRVEERLDVIKNAIKIGMSNEQISLLTGLSVEEIQEIRNSLK
jgi:predicted transposase YdaD